MIQKSSLLTYLGNARAPEALLARLKDNPATEVTDEVAFQVVRAMAARDALVELLRSATALLAHPTDMTAASTFARLITMATGFSSVTDQPAVLALVAGFRDAVANVMSSVQPNGNLREAQGWIFKPWSTSPTHAVGGQAGIVGTPVSGGAIGTSPGKLPIAAPAPVLPGPPPSRRTGNPFVDAILDGLTP